MVELNNLPENMPKVKHWASLLVNRCFIGDLQTSTSARGDAAFFSFKLMGGEQRLVLPATKGITLHFKQKGTTKNAWLARTGNLSIQYKRSLLAFSRLSISEFRHGDKLFDFKLGMEVTSINDAQMIAQILNYFIEAKGTAGKFTTMHQQLNARLKANMSPIPPQLDDVNAYLKILRQYFKGEALQEAFFKAYIQGKTNKETDKNLHQFFGNTSGPLYDIDISKELSRLNDPSFNLATETPEKLLIPYPILKMPSKPADSALVFDYQYLYTKFDLATRNLTLVFKGKHEKDIPLTSLKIWAFDAKKGADWKPATQLRGKKEAQLIEIKMVIAEDKLSLFGKDFEENEYLIQQLAWPTAFLKTTIKDWK